MKLLQKLFSGNERTVARLKTIVNNVNALEQHVAELTDEQLHAKTEELRSHIAVRMERFQGGAIDEGFDRDKIEDEQRRQRTAYQQAILDDLLPEAFAVVREAAKRTIGQRHYDVQVMGGVALHQGKIAEMKTGEGKTLVATLPLYLNALLGEGAHLITVNDFLAKYHAQWMGQVYYALGMSCAAVTHDKSWIFTPESVTDQREEAIEAGLIDPDWPLLRACTRQEAYAADITYGTNNEFGFDYLRDNMVYRSADMVQRGFRFAIIDEVDSILIDEARTPLIISAPAEESASLYGQFAAIVAQLDPEKDYKVDEKDRAATITDEGIAHVEQLTNLDNFYDPKNIMLVHHLEAALKARALFKRDKDYVVRDNEIVIVDEFTGRLMEGRRYSEGLHQAIEAKEGVEVKRESDTLATISFQNLFRMYDKLAGMTGTAETESEEFWKIYGLEVVVMPTHRANIRVDYQDRIYKNETAKLAAVVADVKERQAAGQPVLIGTISVEKNEHLSRLLNQAGVKHETLNAKNHEREAQVIAQAGRLGSVTLATNMAGRGVDIILGGMPSDPEEARKVRELGGLRVIGTERHESRRIDNQLRGRAGRQGDPGQSIFYVSMEDDLMRIFGGEKMKMMMERLGLPDEEAIEHKMISGALEQAQRRVEGHNFDIRKHLVEYDDVMNRHRQVIYRKRRRILELDPLKDGWLHEEILDLLEEDEQPKFEAKLKTFTEEVMKQLERAVYLRTIDMFWIEHLNAMQELREGIGLRGYGQHDPLVEYKHEAHNLFNRLLDSIDDEVIEIILKTELTEKTAPTQTIEPEKQREMTYQGADESMAGGAISNMARAETASQTGKHVSTNGISGNLSDVEVTVRSAGHKADPVKNADKVGRNDPCPCGSGKKYKKCHGQ